MSDIHQEWRELREKNGNFINHLDGEMAKIEKKQVELERREQMQDLTDAGAFVMQFVAPPPFNCCQDDRDILKALNKAQVDRIKALEEELLALNVQLKTDLAVKKDLDEKLDKAAADYKALWVENDRLKDRINRAQTEVVRLTHLNGDLEELNEKAEAELKSVRLRWANDADSNKQLVEAVKQQEKKIQEFERALNIAAKDADANFERGKIKGMEEIWDELGNVYGRLSTGENEKIFGYRTVGEIVDNLSPTWFMRKAKEYHEQKEKEASVIKIGDEVEIFDPFCPGDDPHSDIGIVIAIDKDHPCFAVIGPKFESCFDETDIQAGNVKKTGRHFDCIPLDYLA